MKNIHITIVTLDKTNPIFVILFFSIFITNKLNIKEKNEIISIILIIINIFSNSFTCCNELELDIMSSINKIADGIDIKYSINKISIEHENDIIPNKIAIYDILFCDKFSFFLFICPHSFLLIHLL